MHPLHLLAAEQIAVGLGVIKDGCKVAVPATQFGFGIARAATAAGIWIARAAVRGTAAVTDFAVPDNPVGVILRGVDTTIGIRTEMRGRVALGCVNLSPRPKEFTQPNLGPTLSRTPVESAQTKAKIVIVNHPLYLHRLQQ